jgi:HD-GYP domain-containing protein (c-di-GMP phosphodiesterase class II)
MEAAAIEWAMEDRNTFCLPDLAMAAHDPRFKFIEQQGFVSGAATPLIAKNQLKGVLEVFSRKPLDFSNDWMDFFETLGGQAAIAVDRLELFEDLEETNLALIDAYDATIEGWSRALDLRDHETEGHSLRVTNLTLKLARHMGFDDEESLTKIRWGSLLHDMGKVGIPDQILQKPGPLSPEEWAIMRTHPSLAYSMLKPIEYLEGALDIPYCHHERWDGSGYPRGISGEEIPLVARIFAVVDVWDALTSDRPYRRAWSRDETLEYIISQSGTHFDPAVVRQFIKIVDLFPTSADQVLN